jgi:hypothetical protein
LTTNLISCIDESFESHISYAVRFCDLSRDDRQDLDRFYQTHKDLPSIQRNFAERGRSMVGGRDQWTSDQNHFDGGESGSQ